MNIKTQKFYWKKSRKANSDEFIWFLTQLRQHAQAKEIVIILDNASIHKSKKVKGYLKRHKTVHLFYLPPYAPEYNPVELFWKWIKPKVYGFSALGGIEERMEESFRAHQSDPSFKDLIRMSQAQIRPFFGAESNPTAIVRRISRFRGNDEM